MLKRLPTTLLFLVSLTITRGQNKQHDHLNPLREDVVRLTNNWILRGRIVLRTDSTLRIQTRDGNVFSFPASQVQNVTTEPAWPLQNPTSAHWTNYTELGPLIAGKTSIDGVTTAAFSFQTLIGYKFRSSLLPGLGAGADLYATQTILPIFATLRGDLLQKPNYSLFAFADAGYGINITQRSSTPAITTTYQGGLLYAAGLGVRIPFNASAGFLLSLGYRYQKTTITTAEIPSPVIYRRLALRAGFYL